MFLLQLFFPSVESVLFSVCELPMAGTLFCFLSVLLFPPSGRRVQGFDQRFYESYHSMKLSLVKWMVDEHFINGNIVFLLNDSKKKEKKFQIGIDFS